MTPIEITTQVMKALQECRSTASELAAVLDLDDKLIAGTCSNLHAGGFIKVVARRRSHVRGAPAAIFEFVRMPTRGRPRK